METVQKPRMTPKDFFMQFGALVALYVSVGAFFNLLFTLVDRVFPDALDTTFYYSASVYSSGMRLAIASLVIIFPVYLILLWLITRDSDCTVPKPLSHDQSLQATGAEHSSAVSGSRCLPNRATC